MPQTIRYAVDSAYQRKPLHVGFGIGNYSPVTVRSNVAGQQRTIRTTNSSLFILGRYNGVLDLINPSGADLTLTSDIRLDGSTTDSYGLIYLLGGATLNAQGVTFSNNTSSNSASVIVTNNYYYIDPEIPFDPDYPIYTGRNILNLERAAFAGNKAEYYGAAIVARMTDIFADGAEFSSNSSRGYGGALYLTDGTVAQIRNANFRYNQAGVMDATSPTVQPGYGGAIYAANSDLDVKGTNFLNNRATGSGGAILFDSSDGATHTLTLGSFAGTSSQMTGNLANYVVTGDSGDANSITFANTSALFSTINVNVDVEGADNHFNMNDPMAVTLGSNLRVSIAKTGDGSWNLYGGTNLSAARQGARLDIAQGTLLLGNESRLNMVSVGNHDSLTVQAGARFVVGNAGVPGPGVTVETSDFSVVRGGTLQLNNDLNLLLAAVNDPTGSRNNMAGTISGGGDLVLAGQGTLKFTGNTANYSGDLVLGDGELVIDSENSFETTGGVALGPDAVLSVSVNPNAPNIKASAIAIDGARININGYYGGTNNYVILESDTAITGNFANNPGSVGTAVNYLTAGFDFNGDRTKYEGTIQLTWDANVTDPENGVFDIDPSTGPASFTVGTVLKDNTGVGKTLTKRGIGTLILSEANQYRGDTLIEAGMLKLTNAQGTGRSGAVSIADRAFLALDFDDADYEQRIYGAGQVVKTGGGTLSLTNITNNFTGGTIIEGGKLRVEDERVLGTGTIAFDGGALLIDAGSAMTLSKNLSAENFADAWIETLSDTTITSTISGDGGLRKTGSGKLTLSGQGAYLGETKIEEGVFAVTDSESLGTGRLVLSEGVIFEQAAPTNAPLDLDRDVELQRDSAASVGQGVVFDTKTDLTLNGAVAGRGRLVKRGSKTLTLSGENTFDGGVELHEGVVEFSKAAHLGGGEIFFDGGTLRNTEAVNNLQLSMSMADGEAIRLETAKDLTITSALTGQGGLVKTGDGTLTLTGHSDFRGETRVQNGVLRIDGVTESKTFVGTGAALTGTGLIYNSVQFEFGSVYQWTFGVVEADSPALHVKGDVTLNKTVFRPVTAGAMEIFPDVLDGWTALKFAGTLRGDEEFYEIDNEFSPFYDFELDYSTPGEVNVIGYHRRDPRQLSDLVAMSVVMPQRNVHRRVFQQIDEELQAGRNQGLNSVWPRRAAIRGQHRHAAGSHAPRLWADMYARNTEYDSNYHKTDPYTLNSFGVQVGYSFLSTPWLSLGVTAGAEFPELKNGRDKVEATDGYLGLYYGQRIHGMWELKGYLGGGTQRFKSYRRDAKYEYRTKYHGDSFEASLELGRPILLGRYMARPHFGFDFAYAGQQATRENALGSEYRTYSDVSLTQVFFRIGLDFQRAHRRADSFFGISYSNQIGGQSLPSTYVYYPVAQSGTRNYGTDLGRNAITLRGGGNLWFDAARSRSLFLNLTGDIFTDRGDGKIQMSGAIGYDHRF